MHFEKLSILLGGEIGAGVGAGSCSGGLAPSRHCIAYGVEKENKAGYKRGGGNKIMGLDCEIKASKAKRAGGDLFGTMLRRKMTPEGAPGYNSGVYDTGGIRPPLPLASPSAGLRSPCPDYQAVLQLLRSFLGHRPGPIWGASRGLLKQRTHAAVPPVLGGA